MELFYSNEAFNAIFKKSFFDSINEHKVYGTGNIFFGRRNKIENGIIMIGDTAGVVSPFSGDGIGMAFDSAKLAAECLSYQKSKNCAMENALSMYEQRWEKLFNRRIFISKLVQNFLLKSSYKRIASRNLWLLHLLRLNSLLVKLTRG
jgi:flavin-dependent dehydrogenase